MYLKRIVSENVGPIEKVDVSPSFDDSGLPKPLIFVGENGSGKSTILSNIIDSFFDFANEEYSNVMVSEGMSKKYYKAILPLEIHSGFNYMYSYLQFENPSANYLFKSGEIDKNTFVEKNPELKEVPFSWNAKGNEKKVQISKENVKESFEKNIVCYFGPDRYEKPVWMANEYYEGIDSHPQLLIKGRWSGELQNPITVKNVTHDNLTWLLDVIVDSRADVSGPAENLNLAHLSANTIVSLRKVRENIELVLKEILGCDAYFSLNFRNRGMSRFCIRENGSERILVPTLDSLSTGQLALLNMFLTVIRYADALDINNGRSLTNIAGIVVVDEIELHLHSNLQRDVLPKLIKLFPKVQFIITSHSPLFLLGMKKEFGDEGFDIVEMPDGNKIDAERFSEFQKAYEYYCETQKHQNEISSLFNQIKKDGSEVPLVITEGHTDWKHMKAAYENLKDKSEFKELFDGLDFEFLEYEAGNSKREAKYKIEMGTSILSMCKDFSKINLNRKYVFIADRDRPDINREFSDANDGVKSWGNNIYSFILPIPSTRSNTPNICIEHLYSDEEIKTEVDCAGVRRRLFMGNEFNKNGVSTLLGLFCEQRNACGRDKIDIIEGREKERVIKLDESDDENYALSKTDFANNVLNKTPPFDNFDFSNFIPIFEIIKEICNKEMV